MRVAPTRGGGPQAHIAGSENFSNLGNACLSEHTGWFNYHVDEACHSGRMNRLRPCEDILLPKAQCVAMETSSSAPPSGRSDASTRSARTSSRSGTSIPLSPRLCGVRDAITSARVSDISGYSMDYGFVGAPLMAATGSSAAPYGQCASAFAHPQTGVAPVSTAIPRSTGQALTDVNGAINPVTNFPSPADLTHMPPDTLHNHQLSIVPTVADYHHQHHEYAAMAEMVEAKKSEIVGILTEITKLTRQQRAQQEELREERKTLDRMEAEIRAQGAEEARTRFQAEVAESRHQLGEELRMLTSELQQERRDSNAKKLGMDAMKNLYEKKCDSKDQEIRELREALADRQIQKAKIRTLTDELRMEREGRVVSEIDETTLPLLPVMFAPEPSMIPTLEGIPGNSARRRLSYSADNNEPIFQAQEGPIELALPLETEALQAQGTDIACPSAPPSTTGVQTTGIGALSSDARRRLSYSRVAATVGTQTPETPAVDPNLGGMAQKLFDSQLEASSVNNTILATPITAEVSFPMDLSFAMASVDAPWGDVTTAHIALPGEVTPPEIAVSSTCCPIVGTSQPFPVDTEIEQTPQIESHDLNPHCVAQQAIETTIVSVPPKAEGTRTPPIAKATAKLLPRLRASANESAACRRSASDRGRAPRVVDRSARSPMRFSMSATPPKVQKESPPRGCVAEKVSLFEQRCTTPSSQTGSLNTPRQVGTGAVPDALRRGPRGAPVPTPTGAGAVASASKLCRAEERAHPRGSDRGSERSSTPNTSNTSRAAPLGHGRATGEIDGSTQVDSQRTPR